MKVRPLHSVLAFAFCALSGWWVGSQLAPPLPMGVSEPSPKHQSASQPEVLQALTGRSKMGSRPLESPLAEKLGWEQKLTRVSVGDFPSMFESELVNGGGGERIFRLLQVWSERDLNGLVAWARNQPESRKLGAAGHHIGINSTVIDALTKRNPEEAWRVAGQLAGSKDSNRWGVVGSLLGNDPDKAAEFVRKHRDVLAASNQLSAFYGQDPVKCMPACMELPVCGNIVWALARYYTERPEEKTGAQTWFAALPPEYQQLMANLAETGSISLSYFQPSAATAQGNLDSPGHENKP
jgi:hypothetical protein